MGRSDLASDEGMLFSYNKPTEVSFWMKNVPINLNAYWIDDDNRVIGMTPMKPCRSEPCVRYPSPGPVRYVLELSDKSQQIKAGHQLRFQATE